MAITEIILKFSNESLCGTCSTNVRGVMMIDGRIWMVVGAAAPSVTRDAALRAADVYLRDIAM